MATTMRLNVGCEFRLNSTEPGHAIFQVEPLQLPANRRVDECWALMPALTVRRYIDIYGNACRRLDLPVADFSLRYEGTFDVPAGLDPAVPDASETPPGELPDEVLVYTLPSRYCLSDELAGEAWERFGDVAPGWGRVQAICDFVNGHLTYTPGATSSLTTAADVHASQAGVCRDFAHLAIALCRALYIPARYAFGYLPNLPDETEPNDFCAWMEVWLDGQWYTFDPRNNHRRSGRLLIGRGRDALDCAMLTTFGELTLEELRVWADVIEPPA
ncbi:MAG: transglutaminase-like domain-containing protein [Tepidiformaceae bacterium]